MSIVLTRTLHTWQMRQMHSAYVRLRRLGSLRTVFVMQTNLMSLAVAR